MKDKLRQRAQALVDKLDLIHKDEEFRAVWFCAYNHGVAYRGPQYDGELADLKAVLSRLPKEEDQ